MLRLPSRVKLHLSRIDRALEESRRIRDEARVRSVREQLWELHMALREREAEDAVRRSYGSMFPGEITQCQASPGRHIEASYLAGGIIGVTGSADSGTSIRNTQPRPGMLRTWTSPPCARTALRAME